MRWDRQGLGDLDGALDDAAHRVRARHRIPRRRRAIEPLLVDDEAEWASATAAPANYARIWMIVP